MPVNPSGMLSLASVLLAAALACSTSPEPLPPDDDLRILFIGNSLTYENDLPGMVEQLGLAVEGKALAVQSVAVGGYSLEDHWKRGEAVQAIAGGKWDLVVLQQGPSALPESRVLLVEYADTFAAEIRKAGGRPALYMVWPEAARRDVWDDVTESYAAAARAVSGTLFPVGEALRGAARLDPGLELFAGDGFHPSPAATYLAALVIYAQATKRSPKGISSLAHVVPLTATAAGILETAAADAIARFSIP
jgi:hypothetical protein